MAGPDPRELIGKRVLIRRVGSTEIKEVRVVAVSKSGKYLKVAEPDLPPWLFPVPTRWISLQDYVIEEVLD